MYISMYYACVTDTPLMLVYAQSTSGKWFPLGRGSEELAVVGGDLLLYTIFDDCVLQINREKMNYPIDSIDTTGWPVRIKLDTPK